MKKVLRLLFVVIIFLPATAFADTYFWTGADCQVTNNAQFSNAGNWNPLNPLSPPTPSPGSGDVLIFDTAYKTGSCTNDPFDDISSNILGQIAHWGGITITGTFDGLVQFSNFNALTPLQDPTGSYNVDLRIDGNLIMDSAVSSSIGIRLTSSSATNKVYANYATLAGNIFNKNTANPFMFHGQTLDITDSFTFNSGACNNPSNGKTGGFNYTESIQIIGNDFIDCYYSAPIININPDVTNNWRWDFANNDNLYFENSVIYWDSQNTVSSSYEIHQNHASNTLTFSNSTLNRKATNPLNTVKLQAHQGSLNVIDSTLDIATVYLGNQLTSTFTNAELKLEEFFFEDSANTNTWLNSFVYIWNVLQDTDSFGFNPNTNYNMNLNFTSPTGAYIQAFYPVDLTSDWNYPNYNITLANASIQNNGAGATRTNVLTLIDTAGIGIGSDYYPQIVANEIIGDASNPVSQPIFAVDIHATNWTDIDKFSGYITGDANYSRVTYNSLPTLSVTGTTNLLAGGTPHVVRELITPPNGTILIAGNHTFEWSEEWGVDGYECQLDEVGDNFASLDISWSNTGQTNTTELVDLNPLNDETYYEWRCRTEKTDVNGVQQFSNWTDASQLFLLYHFQNTAHNNTMAFDWLSSYTTPQYNTPVNRSLGSKLDIDLDFAMFNVSTIDCNVSYNDDFFTVSDDITIIGAVQSSTTTLIVNEKEFDAPLDGRTYDVSCLATHTPSGQSLWGNFSFAVRASAVGTGGGGTGNVSVAVSDFNREAVSIGYTGALFIILGILFFYVGSRTKKQQVIIEQDEDYT